VAAVVVLAGYVDSHIHLHEYGDSWAAYCGRYTMLAVSDDIQSSARTVELARRCPTVVPAVGVHPWGIGGGTDVVGLARELEGLIEGGGVRFLGEVGLDRVFTPGTFSYQLRVFEAVLDLASRYGVGLSVHAAGAWREVFEMLRRYRIEVAVFHWYTGPLDLLEDIVGEGYLIGVNPALRLQRRHEEVARAVPLEALVTESDGPYEYRGLRLGPELIGELLARVAQVKGVGVEEVAEAVRRNFSRALSRVGVDLLSR
jgi:TatD DNase family protein